MFDGGYVTICFEIHVMFPCTLVYLLHQQTDVVLAHFSLLAQLVHRSINTDLPVSVSVSATPQPL